MAPSEEAQVKLLGTLAGVVLVFLLVAFCRWLWRECREDWFRL